MPYKIITQIDISHNKNIFTTTYFCRNSAEWVSVSRFMKNLSECQSILKSFSRNLCNLESHTEFNKNVIYYFCVFWEIYLKLI